LSYPTNEAETDIESFDAVQLFLQHSRRMQSNFALTSLQKPAVVRICRLVGGMPLGIELAASSVRALSLEELAGEIEHGLDILETPARNIEPRHRTMRAALDPMWNALSDELQTVFKKLSVFRGGFRREAVQYVAEASPHTLSILVDRSLVRMDQNGRYDLHELLRQYAEEHLSEISGEIKEARHRHCQYYMTFLAQKEKQLEGAQQIDALADIEREIDNIRAAWQWGVEHKDAVEIGKGCHALWFFYDTHSWYQEGEQSFRAAAEALGLNDEHEEKSIVLGEILASYGALCFSLNMGEDARKFLEQSLSILRPHAAPLEIGFALLRLSEVAMFLEDNALAGQSYLQESLALFRSVGNRWGIAYSLRWLGFAALNLGEYEKARQLSKESLILYEESGEPLGKATALIVAGMSALELGEIETVRQICQEASLLNKAIGLRWNVSNVLNLLGAAASELGDYAEAKNYLYEALNDGLDIQFSPNVLYSLLEIACLMVASGNSIKGLQILSFLLEYPLPPIRGKRPIKRLITKLQGELAPAVFTTALEDGKVLDLETIIQICLDFTRPSPYTLHALSEREQEILQMVAKGFSNREIAQNLIFSVGTVKWYVHQIYDKLGVGSRTQAVDRARELKILS
jgi:DNA-binding CsgD family transcriptional regulator/tetratricopeptide (TPR) repeat protein